MKPLLRQSRLVFVMLCLAASACSAPPNPPGKKSPATPVADDTAARIAAVERIVDGDTIKLRNGERVRYIGVDTPELARDGRPAQPFALEAMECNRALLGNGTVKLVFDEERTDRYGRLLAYVYAGPDHTVMVNRELVRRGCARTLSIAPNTEHAREFRDLERAARAARRGLWAR